MSPFDGMVSLNIGKVLKGEEELPPVLNKSKRDILTDVLEDDVVLLYLQRGENGDYEAVNTEGGYYTGDEPFSITIMLAYMLGTDPENHDHIDNVYDLKEREGEEYVRNITFPSSFIENREYVKKAYEILDSDKREFGDAYKLLNKTCRKAYKFFKSNVREGLDVFPFTDETRTEVVNDTVIEDVLKEHMALMFLVSQKGIDYVVLSERVWVHLYSMDIRRALVEVEGLINIDIEAEEGWEKLVEKDRTIGELKDLVDGGDYNDDVKSFIEEIKLIYKSFGLFMIEIGRDFNNVLVKGKVLKNMLMINKQLCKASNEGEDRSKSFGRTTALILVNHILYSEYKMFEEIYLEKLEEEKVKKVDKLREDLRSWKEESGRLEKELNEERAKREEDQEHYKEMLDEVGIKLNKKDEEELKYQDKINELKREKEELEKELRKREENVEGVEEEADFDEMKDEIKERKIAIVGGHDNWVRKMKEEDLGIEFVDAQKYLRKSPGTLTGYDYVIFNTWSAAHKVDYKLKSEGLSNLRRITVESSVETGVQAIYDLIK